MSPFSSLGDVSNFHPVVSNECLTSFLFVSDWKPAFQHNFSTLEEQWRHVHTSAEMLLVQAKLTPPFTSFQSAMRCISSTRNRSTTGREEESQSAILNSANSLWRNMFFIGDEHTKEVKSSARSRNVVTSKITKRSVMCDC